MILVTGGTGFIGSLLIEQLLNKGESVWAIKRSTSTIPESLLYKTNLFWFDADITDYFSLSDAFKTVDRVYHCAGMVSFNRADRKQLMKINVEGTHHIVNLCLENKARLLYVSSVAALGDNKENGWITEDTKWEWSRDKSDYSISKFEAEREVWRGIAEGLDAVIVNPTLVIGEEGKSNTGELFALLKRGVNYYPTGSTGFVDVQDLVSIMIRLMDNREITGTNFLINNVNLSYEQLFTKFATLINSKPPSKRLTPALLNLAWRMQKLMAIFTRKRRSLTKEIAQACSKKNSYSNQKIVQTLDYNFKPIDESLKEIGG